MFTTKQKIALVISLIFLLGTSIFTNYQIKDISEDLDEITSNVKDISEDLNEITNTIEEINKSIDECNKTLIRINDTLEQWEVE